MNISTYNRFIFEFIRIFEKLIHFETMAELSPNRRGRELTNLEMEAHALVNEELLGPDVTDEERYEALLEQRK